MLYGQRYFVLTNCFSCVEPNHWCGCGAGLPMILKHFLSENCSSLDIGPKTNVGSFVRVSEEAVTNERQKPTAK